MDWTTWAVPVATLCGAGLAFLGGWVGTRQREHADRRAESGRRLNMALGQLSDGADPRRRSMGRTILESLVNDSLVSDDDKKLAKAVLDDDLNGTFVVPSNGLDDDDVDEPADQGDNEGDTLTGGAR